MSPMPGLLICCTALLLVGGFLNLLVAISLVLRIARCHRNPVQRRPVAEPAERLALRLG